MTGPIDNADGGRPIVRRCTAHITRGPEAGRRCRRSAVRGATVCTAHGGSAPQVKAAAARRVAEAEALTAYERWAGPNGHVGAVNIIAELARLVSAVTAFREFTEGRLRALSADEWASHGPRVAAEVRMFETACDQARRLLRDVARLGLEKQALEAEREAAVRDVWVQRRVGEQVAEVIRRVLVELGVDIRRAGVGEAVARNLRHISAHGSGAGDG